ncbi:DUF4879 domain-containing protein [Pseudomonas sp. MWU13-2105]|uniref:DUF4879 domain-containing protein n=1 Tax=Pseudomonas sp. MWU13-2105 TaxID=2935074 RepID=UPI00200D631E|nr:DUF4879 domain-containing protein [Pseudomonas sp. MWU13-2105]
MSSRVKSLVLGLGAVMASAVLTLSAAPAQSLIGVAIYTVASQDCVEDVSDGRMQTRCKHSGPITVTVVESGYGRGLQAFLNGVPLQYASRGSLCEFRRPFVPCSVGKVVGYRFSYVFELDRQQAVTFVVGDRSLTAPVQTMGAEIQITPH